MSALDRLVLSTALPEAMLFKDNPRSRRLHFKNLQGIINAFCGMVQDQARVGNVCVEQFILPAAVVQVTLIDLAILVDMVVQRQLGFVKGLAVDHDVIRF